MCDSTRRPDPSGSAPGHAMIMALFFLILAVGIVYSGTVTADAHRTNTDTQFRSRTQATQFARSGLTEAISWFRRQTSQPVTDFAPRLETLANPPLLDTDDPDIGLVREFRIGGRVFGRYETWKEWLGDPEPARAALRTNVAARDVSSERTAASGGSAWRLRSVGYVFESEDEQRPFDQLPNRVLARQVLEGEILRLRLAPPGASAICTSDGALVTIGTNTEVEGGTGAAGLFARTGTGSPSVSGSLGGQPGFLADANYTCSPEIVFGVSERDLETTADLIVEQALNVPVPLPTNALVVIDAGPIVFDAARPLRGTAVVYVKGDVTIAAGSASSFNGLLYVDGDLQITAPADLSGAVVVSDGHRVTLTGTADWVHVQHDGEVLDLLRREIGQYRLAGPIRTLTGSDG